MSKPMSFVKLPKPEVNKDLLIWYEHFFVRKNNYLNQEFDYLQKYMSHYYGFLQKDQIMGRCYDFLKIPNIMGKIDKSRFTKKVRDLKKIRAQKVEDIPTPEEENNEPNSLENDYDETLNKKMNNLKIESEDSWLLGPEYPSNAETIDSPDFSESEINDINQESDDYMSSSPPSTIGCSMTFPYH